MADTAEDIGDAGRRAGVEAGSGSSEIRKIYNSIKDSPNYPNGFTKVQNGTKKVKVNNSSLLEELRKIEPSDWNKVCQNGYSNGQEVSIHYSNMQKQEKYLM